MRNRLKYSVVGAIGILLLALPGRAQQQHAATGLLLKVDSAHKTLVISCRDIPGYMEAMVMPFAVQDARALDELKPGMILDFDLIDRNGAAYADNIHVRAFQSLELDPTQAKRLRGVEDALAPSGSKGVPIGERVPDFTLLDQNGRRVRLSQFNGKVVALTFLYTRCPFPNYCVRLSNNFARLQKRFHDQMGHELVLLSIVIDAVHDQPKTLEKYATMWKADPSAWHFLTGSADELQQVCRHFEMNYYPDEALYIHSFHTAVIDQQGKLAANLEGNEFTAQQLGDFVESVIRNPK
jgi:protein SCO1/2